MKHTQNEKGFSIVEILIVIVIVIAMAAGGYLVYKDHHKTVASAALSTATTTTKSTSSTTTTFKVSELGIELLNVPVSISDLTYAIVQNDSYGIQAQFSTTSLSNLDKRCSPSLAGEDGGLTRIPGTYDTANPPEESDFIKQFSGFWINYIQPAGTCSSSSKTMSLEISQTSTFQTLVTNASNIEAIQ
jgi:Tfp pilus assembly protein PilE